MKICAYVQEEYAKKTYKNECMDKRQFVGLRVIIDCLERAGYNVEYAGIATVHEYDVVLVSLTSDCDWWSFISERIKWRKGNYKVIIGGSGLLHVTPFIRWAYAVIWGRGENIIVPLINGIDKGNRFYAKSVAYYDEFDEDDIYYIEQATTQYPYKIALSDKRCFEEGAIGCNHKCLFCGYTWQRKFVSKNNYYAMSDGIFGGIEDKERAMLDLYKDESTIDFKHLRTTAIDGFSERIRNAVNKPITKKIMVSFIKAMINSDANPHQLKLYNICGYPTENIDDWKEYIETLREADLDTKLKAKQWSIVLHSTPFRAMPATPLACAAMSKINYRGKMAKILGNGLKGNLIYQGKNIWSVESMGTESLSSVMLSAIAHRGSRDDSENIERLCRTPKFWNASSLEKEITLAKYFDMDKLFGAFNYETLPSRYLRTYANVEKLWGKTKLEMEYKNE